MPAASTRPQSTRTAKRPCVAARLSTKAGLSLMRSLTFDAEANATYIYVVQGEQITHTTTVHEDGKALINLDFAGDKLVGVEIVSFDTGNT